MKLPIKTYVDQQVQWVRDLKQRENDWLKTHAEAELKDVRATLDSEIRSLKERLEREVETSNQRFHSQNEWRQAFKDQQTTFLTRREFWAGILMVAIAFLALYFKK